VLPLTAENESTASSVEQGCAAGLLERGIKVVERSQVDSVLSEKRLSRGGEVRTEDYQEMGRMLGVDAFVAGSVSAGDFIGKVLIHGASLRLIDAQTGEVLRIASWSRGSGEAERDGAHTGTRGCVALLSGSDPGK